MCFGYMSAHHVNLSDHTLTSRCIHQRFVVDVRQWRGWHGTSFGSSCTRRPLWIHVCARNKKPRISQCNVNTTSHVLPEKVGHAQTHRYASRRWLIDDVIDDDVPLHDRLTSCVVPVHPKIQVPIGRVDSWVSLVVDWTFICTSDRQVTIVITQFSDFLKWRSITGCTTKV